jgi:hypothetical protein
LVDVAFMFNAVRGYITKVFSNYSLTHVRGKR